MSKNKDIEERIDRLTNVVEALVNYQVKKANKSTNDEDFLYDFETTFWGKKINYRISEQEYNRILDKVRDMAEGKCNGFNADFQAVWEVLKDHPELGEMIDKRYA